MSETVYVLIDEYNKYDTCKVFRSRKKAEDHWDSLRGSHSDHQGYHIEERNIIE